MSFLDDLRSNKYSTKDLGKRHGFSKGKASNLVKRLEIKGIIEVKRTRICLFNGEVGNLQNEYKVML